MEIKFSHDYPKLHNQDRATLLSVLVRNRSDLSKSFVRYDTIYFEPEGVFPSVEKFYPLPDGKYLVLVFLGSRLIPFTTIRPFSVTKFEFYSELIGHKFSIMIKK